MKRWTPNTILLTAWLVFVCAAYPGYVDEYGVNMLADARSAWYSGAQSPTMTSLWSVMEWFIAGPSGMFLLQGTALLLCAYHLMRGALSDRASAYLAGALLLLPPVLATSSIICPDAQFVAFLLLGLVGLRAKNRPAQIAGGIALLVAGCVRPLGAAAAFPLLAIALPIRLSTRWRQIGAALIATVTLAFISVGVNKALVDGDEHSKVRTDRGMAFAQTLGTSPVRTWRPTYTRFVISKDVGKQLHVVAKHSRVQSAIEKIVRASGKTPLFYPLVYFILEVALFGFLAIRRDPLPFAIAASGMAHELALYWVDGAPRFEHSNWLIISTLLAAALSWRRFRRPEPSPAAPPDPLPLAESPAPASAA
ncbi:MAG TPA: hypothetical protein VGM90_33005 [Kofleriaceae bacterium]